MTASPRTQQRIGEKNAKQGLLWLAGVRMTAGVIALPLFPLLFREHFLVLVLLRPTQGVLLAGAFLARQGHVSLPQMLLAAIPLQVVAIWLYFALGRLWKNDIDGDDELPFVAARLLNRDQTRRLCSVLKKKGARLAFLARFAIFPTGLLSGAVGASDLKPRRYLLADGAGLFVATAVSVGAGYVLGVAQDRAGPWLVAVGVAGVVALSGTLTWLLQRD